MTIEAQYAQALYTLVDKKQERATEYVAGLVKVLKTKGHQKLARRVYAQYLRIIEQRERSARYLETTPEKKRKRVLLELYRVLVR